MAVYNARERYVVNCTNTGFQHPAMLAVLPVATEVLIFTGLTLDTIYYYHTRDLYIPLLLYRQQYHQYAVEYFWKDERLPKSASY